MSGMAWWQRARDEWQANRRLRLAALVAVVFVALHALAGLESRRQALAVRHASDLALLARMEGLRDQTEWDARAAQAEDALDQMRARVPEVTGAGLAQAELQNWLTELAARTGLAGPGVRVEDTLDVPGYPDMWQVMARLEGQIPQYGEGAFLQALSEGLPWIQVERLEIGDGTPARAVVTVRGYYRRAQAGNAAASARADGIGGGAR